MYLKLRHAVALALVVGLVSVLLYRFVTSGTEAPVMVVAPLPSAPPLPPLVPEPWIRPERHPAETRPFLDLEAAAVQCAACDAELVGYRQDGSLASRIAMELCVRRKCRPDAPSHPVCAGEEAHR